MDKSVTDFNVRLRTIKLRELAAGIVITMVVMTLVLFVLPEIMDNDDVFFIALLTCILLFFVWELRGTTGLSNNVKNVFAKKTRNEILYVFAVNLTFAFIFTCVISILDIMMGIYDPGWVSVLDIDSVDVSTGTFVLSSIVTIIFAPLLEELMFRGVLFNRLKIRIGFLPAMLVSSFIFAIGHDFGGITSAFLFGICMCILYMKTDNILVPMSVHFINNLVATGLELTDIDYIIGQIPWIIPATIIVLISTILLIKYIVEETGKIKKSLN